MLCKIEWQNSSLESKILLKRRSYRCNNEGLASLLLKSCNRLLEDSLAADWDFSFLDSTELSQLVICSYKYLAASVLLFRIDEIWNFPLLLTVSIANWYGHFGSWTLSHQLHSCNYTGTLLDWSSWLPKRAHRRCALFTFTMQELACLQMIYLHPPYTAWSSPGTKFHTPLWHFFWLRTELTYIVHT